MVQNHIRKRCVIQICHATVRSSRTLNPVLKRYHLEFDKIETVTSSLPLNQSQEPISTKHRSILIIKLILRLSYCRIIWSVDWSVNEGTDKENRLESSHGLTEPSRDCLLTFGVASLIHRFVESANQSMTDVTRTKPF